MQQTQRQITANQARQLIESDVLTVLLESASARLYNEFKQCSEDYDAIVIYNKMQALQVLERELRATIDGVISDASRH